MKPSPSSDEAIFSAALALPPTARAAFLDAACAGDASRRARIENLLRVPDEAPDFMATSAAEVPRPIDTSAGDLIGRYKLLQKIGEGGIGVVFMAEQEEPIRRRVAVKVIKLGMDTKEVVARFEAERQALALMDHPNIARVFDAGATASGRPFFVMELVRGIPITTFCDEQNLPTRMRLDLFTSVCHAVQHAHQKGIIHRDLKPSNILVTIHDGLPVPKVIDFGIAKATQGRLTDATLFTAFDQFIGTPAYMSPEQAEMSSLDVDTRSDIYSLGILLYELLAGRPPFDPKTLVAAGIDEIRRIIREVDPPRPSTRLNTLGELDRATVARQRGVPPTQLSTLLRGDLDWIVMKALEKQRSRRYETPSAFAADIRRHLHHEPVQARPPSKVYLLQKTIARHRLAAVAALAVASAVMIGSAIAVLQAIRARHAEKTARRESAALAVVNEFLNRDLLSQASSRRQAQAGFTPEPNVTLRQVLDRTLPRLESQFKDQPHIEATIRQTLGGAYRQLGDYAAAMKHFERAITLRTAALGPDHPDTLASRHDLGNVHRIAMRFADVRKSAADVAARRARVLGLSHPDTLETVDLLAHAYRYTGLQAEILPLLERTVQDVKVKRGSRDVKTLNAMNNLAQAYREVGRVSEASVLFDESLRHRQALIASGQVDDADVGSHQAAFRDLDRMGDAIPMLEGILERRKTSLGNDHPETVDALMDLAIAFCADDQHLKATPLLEETLRRRNAMFGPNHSDTLTSMDALATAWLNTGRTGKAIQLLEETLRGRKAALGADYPFTIATMCTLAAAYRENGRLPEAIALSEEAMQRFTATFGRNHNDTFNTAAELASLYHDAGRHIEALALSEELFQRRKNQLGPLHPYTLECMADLAKAYRKAAQSDRAHALFEETLRLCEAQLGKTHERTLKSLRSLAEMHQGAGRLPEAIALYEEVVRRRKESLGSDHLETLESTADLAAAYRAAGRNAEAISLYEAVVKGTKEKRGPDRPHRNSLYALASMLEPPAAEPLRRELLAAWRNQQGIDSPAANLMHGLLGKNLLEQGKFMTAETELRAAMAKGEQIAAPDWQVTTMRSLLGASLVGQKKFVEAEPLLISSYEALTSSQTRMPASEARAREALGRIVQLYTAWEKPGLAAEWQRRLGAVPKP